MKTPDKIVLIISTGYVLFHLLIMLGILPDTIVWGGKALSPSTLIILELTAIFVMSFIIFLILLKNNRLRWKWQDKTLNRWMLGFFDLFYIEHFG